MANEEMIQKHLDNFLAKIAGETPVDDEPRDSTEFWLKQIAEQGGGGGGAVYRHVITCYSSTIGATIILYNKDNTPFTINALNAWLKTHSIGTGGSITYDKHFYPCAGYLTDLINTSNKVVTIITFCGIMANYSYSNRVTMLCKSTVIPYADSTISPSTNNIVTYDMSSIVDTVSEV